MKKLLLVTILSLSVLLSACKSQVISVELPSNDCNVVACTSEHKSGSLVIFGTEFVK